MTPLSSRSTCETCVTKRDTRRASAGVGPSLSFRANSSSDRRDAQLFADRSCSSVGDLLVAWNAGATAATAPHVVLGSVALEVGAVLAQVPLQGLALDRHLSAEHLRQRLAKPRLHRVSEARSERLVPRA